MEGRYGKFGDYVYYQPSLSEYLVMPEESGYHDVQRFNPSNNVLWKVLYCGEDTLELISARSIGVLALEGKIGFANAVDTLSRLCQAYVNPYYAVKGRSIGSTDKSVGKLNPDVCSFECLMGAHLNEEAPYHEAEYQEDLSWLRCTGVMAKSDREVWLASRQIEPAPAFNAIDLGLTVWNGHQDKKSTICLYRAYQQGGGYDYRVFAGVRPVILLKENVLLNGGNGSKNKPYNLIG